jgi:Lon protease-like protein
LNWVEEAPSVVRLFPLGSVVLLPHATLPLHIFEPRYREMTADALEGDRRIAMVLPRYSEDEEPRPIHSVVCVGVIYNELRLPDGRYKLLLKGEGRMRITSELSMGDKLYRRAYATPIEDEVRPQGGFSRRMHRAMLLGQLRRLARSHDCPTTELHRHLRDSCSDSAFVDLLAYSLPCSMEFKQRILETPCVDERLERLSNELTRMTGVPTCGAAETGFSVN